MTNTIEHATMLSAAELDPVDIGTEFDSHIQCQYAKGFLELCREIKQAIGDLIEQNLRLEALELLRVYERVFEDVENWHPAFILAVIGEFPVNRDCTFHLLGISEEIDQVILEQKLNTKTRQVDKIKDIDFITLWAIRNNDLAMMEDIIVDACQLAVTKFGRDPYIKHQLSESFIKTLISHENTDYLSSPRIDEAIASIVDIGDDKKKGLYVSALARLGMPKTLMKMLEHGRTIKCLQESHKDYEHILACIPQQMTPTEMNAALHHLELDGLAEKILFDENIDLDAYITAVGNSCYVDGRGTTDLGLTHLEYFEALITEDNFTGSIKKKRIIKLLDALCEAEKKASKTNNIRMLAERHHVPRFTFKYIACLRGQELEDALGL